MPLKQYIQTIFSQLCNIRRHIHKYPETGWNEYYTTAFVVKFLQDLGLNPIFGADAVQASSRLYAPSSEQCAKERARAIAQGADANLVEAMGDGLTGLWVDIGCPDDTAKGPILALRVDMDAIGIDECTDISHRPYKEGFGSCNAGSMHACGHDGHVSIGLGLALVLHKMRHELNGVVRLIFQSSEELGQGAKAMLDAGAMHGVHELVGVHLGVQALDSKTIICGTSDFLAVTSFELSYFGKAAHAGLAPHEGQNALMAAISAVQGMQSIARHGQGATRVNVGQFIVDGSPNIIPAKAWLAGETRGIDSQINDWMLAEVMRISKAAAEMWDCGYEFCQTGLCISGYSDEKISQEIYDIASTMPCFENVILNASFFASEDFTWFLKDVQNRGGQGTYIQVGVDLSAGHHNEKFDFDEDALSRAVELLARFTIKKLGGICA